MTKANHNDLLIKILIGACTAMVTVIGFFAASTYKELKDAIVIVEGLKTVPAQLNEIKTELSGQNVRLSATELRLNYIEHKND